MANRRGKTEEKQNPAESTDSTDTSTEEAPVTDVTEQETTEQPTDSADSTTDESTDSPTTETESDKPAKAAEPDLTDFKAAVATAVEESDKSTGDVPVEQLSLVTTAYRALEGLKAKNAARKFVDDSMKDAMNSDNLPLARANLQISDKALIAASKSAGEKAPADPTENFVQRVATLQIGWNLATGNVPEGVKEDWNSKVEALVNETIETAREYLTWATSDPETRGDEPEVSSVVRNSVKLAQGKSAKAGVSRGGGTFTGDRKDIGVHIENAFSDKPVGTFLKISEIRGTKSDEYGDTPPSAGAISARLFPKSGKSTMNKVGIAPDTREGKKGAVKIELDESDDESSDDE